jgi:hypothetical protein
MVNPTAYIFIFLGMCDFILAVVPDVRACVAGGCLTSVLAILTIRKL